MLHRFSLLPLVACRTRRSMLFSEGVPDAGEAHNDAPGRACARAAPRAYPLHHSTATPSSAAWFLSCMPARRSSFFSDLLPAGVSSSPPNASTAPKR